MGSSGTEPHSKLYIASSRIMVPPRAERVWGLVSVARSGPGKVL